MRAATSSRIRPRCSGRSPSGCSDTWLPASLSIVVFIGVYRRPTAEQLALGLATITLVAFVSLTTMHERYAYPAFVFLLLRQRAGRS